MSGSSSSSPVMARCTQSVGVPSTRMNPSGISVARMGLSRVRELLAPLRSRSGATTVTRPTWPSDWASMRMPGAW